MKIMLFPDLSLLQDELNKIFNRFVSVTDDTFRQEGTWTPLTDCYETGNELIFKIELPGVKKEDILLEVRSGYLYVEGKKHQTKDSTLKGFLQVERNYGKFSRYIPINKTVNFDEVNARLKNGMLIIRFPLLEEKRKPELCIQIKEE